MQLIKSSVDFLAAIEPWPDVDFYLHDNWIRQEDREKAARDDGHPTVYEDQTYAWLAGICIYTRPKRILEIGLYKGFSAATFVWANGMCDRSSLDLLCVVDNAKETGPRGMRHAEIKLERAMHTRATLLSLQLDTQTDEWQQVPRHRWDLIHIDADHSYEGCLNDLNHFAPLVSEWGVVVVHDYEDEAVQKACYAYAMPNHWPYRLIRANEGDSKGHFVMMRGQRCP